MEATSVCTGGSVAPPEPRDLHLQIWHQLQKNQPSRLG